MPIIYNEFDVPLGYNRHLGILETPQPMTPITSTAGYPSERLYKENDSRMKKVIWMIVSLLEPSALTNPAIMYNGDYELPSTQDRGQDRG